MASNNEERSYQYFIPENYTNSARILGFLEIRNAVELIAIAGSMAFSEIKLLHVPVKAKIIILCVTVIPVSVILAMGIDGCSLTEYMARILRSYKDRKYLVRKEAYYGVEAEAAYARSGCKRKAGPDTGGHSAFRRRR